MKNKAKAFLLAGIYAVLCSSCDIKKSNITNNNSKIISEISDVVEPKVISIPKQREKVEKYIPSDDEKNISNQIYNYDSYGDNEKYNLKIYNYPSNFVISAELRETIEKTIDSYGKNNGFYIKTLDGNFTCAYNKDVVIFGASTVKAPYCLFCYKELVNGNGTFNEMKTIEKKHWKSGSGTIYRTGKIGNSYSLEQLLYYAINTSDNTAYYALKDRFPKENYNEFIKSLGCQSSTIDGNRNWIDSTPEDLAIIWENIYQFYQDGTELSKIFFKTLDEARYNVIDEVVDVNTVHKSGWTPAVYNESGIVFSDEPYIITILTEGNSGNSKDKKYMRDIISLSYKLNKEYTEYKKENKPQCRVIKGCYTK